MVVASPNPTTHRTEDKIKVLELPIIDLSKDRSEVSRLIVKASEEYGFFKVANHGVPEELIAAMEEESSSFFAKPMAEKQRAGPPNPFGYGCKNIGFNGDIGEVEYLLLNTNLDPISLAQNSMSISSDPTKLSSMLSGFLRAVLELGCEILDLMAEGLRVHDTSVFNRLIRAVDNDSVLRINHYPQCKDGVGFGAHSDPQILTLLRSNDVCGLQISLKDGVWVPVSPDPTTFCINVGDVLQAMTNGRFKSVIHRVMTNSSTKSRVSMAYFCGPPLHARVDCLQEMVAHNESSLYRSFTWGEYKKTIYSLRLGDNRLELFKSCNENDDDRI